MVSRDAITHPATHVYHKRFICLWKTLDRTRRTKHATGRNTVSHIELLRYCRNLSGRYSVFFQVVESSKNPD